MNAIPFDTSIVPRRKVRHVQQTEASECGLASLAMIGSHWGLEVDLGSLRRRFGTSSRGMSLRGLIQTADAMGLSARPLKVSVEGLSRMATPAILHWDMNHYVVLEKISRGRAYIHDPARDSRWHDEASISKHYTGVAVEMRPGTTFEPKVERRRMKISQLWSSAVGAKRSFAQAAVLSLILQFHVLASPYLMQAAVDQVVPTQDASLLTVLAMGFLLLAGVNAVASVLRSFVLLSAGAALSFGISTNISRRLLRLPVEWFEKRTVGDVLSRFQSVLPVQKLLTEGGVATVIDGALAILTLALMFVYSPAIAFVPLGGLAAYGVVRWISLPAERRAQADRIDAGGREQSNMIENLRGIVTLRLSGREAMRHATWQNRLSEQLGAAYSHERAKALQQAAGLLITSVETILVTWMAVHSTLVGGFSMGMVFAFLAYRLQFSTATRSLVDRLSEARMLSLHLDRLSDIAFAEEDPSFSEPTRSRESIRGEITLRSIRFSYGPHDPETLKGIDLHIQAGEHIAITGPSGGGKTTLAKVILGLLEPTHGEILVDGEPLSRMGRRPFREHVAAVLQDDLLLAGTIAENVAGFDRIDDERLETAMRAASIWNDVSAMPLRTHTLVGDMGSSLSGGQRQRILLARALYRTPKVLVMDESTSNLDSGHERSVNEAISKMGVTRIVIAHRKETIACADRVVTLKDGMLHEGCD